MIPPLHDLRVLLPGNLRASIRYSVVRCRKGGRRVFWYFCDRSFERFSGADSVKAEIEEACLCDHARPADHPGGLAVSRATILHEIRLERARQIAEEGYAREHDDRWTAGELALAAAAYALEAARLAQPCPAHALTRLAAECWPFERSAKWPKPPRRLLVIAAALLIAEIERLDRRAEML